MTGSTRADDDRPDQTSVEQDRSGSDASSGLGAVDATTRRFEEHDALVTGGSDRPPTPTEEAEAPTHVDQSVAEAYEAAIERGASTKGEGRIGI